MEKEQLINNLTERCKTLRHRLDYCEESRQRGNRDWEYQAHRMLEDDVKNVLSELGNVFDYLKNGLDENDFKFNSSSVEDLKTLFEKHKGHIH